ncbi:MAG TPA: hypothetical protein VFS97_10580 [Nitrososphaeraceae archaeon]|nr:hypothetical protein [Nitrososphaeraceae archaeon]
MNQKKGRFGFSVQVGVDPSSSTKEIIISYPRSLAVITKLNYMACGAQV